MDSHDRTASLMTPAKLAQVAAQARQPVSRSAFLDQMAADVGHQHVQQLGELRKQLKEQARGSQGATFQPMLQQLADALPSLDFSLLQSKGLWAAVTGKNKSSGAEFAAQFEHLEQAAAALARQVGEVQKGQQAHAGASDRTLVEFEVEYRALDKIIDQGARWLQDMRNQLKERQAQAGADAKAQEEIRADAARCETLVGRLKALRAVAGAAGQAHQQVKATAEKRAALTATVQKALASDLKEWRSSLGVAAAAAAEGKASGLNLEGPKEIHADLAKRLGQLLDACGQLREHEQALVRQLDVLGEQVTAAA